MEGDTVSYETVYEFLPGAKTGTTTTLVSGVRNGSSRLSYTYDALGNIRTVSENGVLKCTYHYDALHQLIREDSVWENQAVCYTYDQGGNLKSRKEYAYTAPGSSVTGTPAKQASYTYGNTAWKDQLTAYHGQTITYDAMGNPLSYRGMTLTWEKGRELKQAVKGSQTITYVYNSEGVRTKKTAGGITTTYYVNGRQILGLKKGSELLQFVYDQNGSLVSLEVNGKSYYYLHNVQNDVIGLIDSSGEQVVSYRYNSWGKLLSMMDTTTEKIGEKNPFRYREYCWDEETGLYYVTSRYYDPETGRFISADDVDVLEVQDDLYDKNLYAYCDNNPINRVDEEGDVWEFAAVGSIGRMLGTAALTISNVALPIAVGIGIGIVVGVVIHKGLELHQSKAKAKYRNGKRKTKPAPKVGKVQKPRRKEPLGKRSKNSTRKVAKQKAERELRKTN